MTSYNSILSYILFDNKKEKMREANDKISVDFDWIDKNISRLLQFATPHDKSKPPQNFTTNDTFNGKCDYDSLQMVLRSMSKHIGLEHLPTLEISNQDGMIWNLSNGLINPGVTTFDGNNFRIKLFNFNKFTHREYHSILAHEVSHVFLKEKQLELSNVDENEIFTDLTAIFLGFGNFLLRGYATIVWSEDFNLSNPEWKHHSYRIGYMTCQDIAIAISRFALINKHRLDTSIKTLPHNDVKWFTVANKINKKHPITRHTIISCPNRLCGKSIRVPELGKKLLVNCPFCKTNFEYDDGKIFCL